MITVAENTYLWEIKSKIVFASRSSQVEFVPPLDSLLLHNVKKLSK